MFRNSCHCLFIQLCSLLLISSLCHSQESCLGPGFTQTIPPEEELSQYSATVLQPGDKAIYTTLSFRCNGTLESLTIPSQVRGSDYSLVDNFLEPRPSIWRCNGTGCYFFVESEERQRTTMLRSIAELIRITPKNVLSFNFTVMLQLAIQAGDVLGFQLLGRGDNGRIEHLPLLYKPGPTPGTFTPIIIANFNPTSDPLQNEADLTQSSAKGREIGILLNKDGIFGIIVAVCQVEVIIVAIATGLMVHFVPKVCIKHNPNLSQDQNGNNEELGAARANDLPLYESVCLGGYTGEFMGVQPSPADYQAASMPEYL